jgi:hypothetical protein
MLKQIFKFFKKNPYQDIIEAHVCQSASNGGNLWWFSNNEQADYLEEALQSPSYTKDSL